MEAASALVLGFGMQGRAVLHALVHHTEVPRIVVADQDERIAAVAGSYPADRVVVCPVDASDEASLSALLKEVDLVVEALPGPLALFVGRLAARLGVHLVSSMYYIDPGLLDEEAAHDLQTQLAELDREAKDNEVVILTEFGLDPGLDLLLTTDALGKLDEVHQLYTYGAGLPTPAASHNPLRYKFSWSVPGVLDAYRRPARVVEKAVVRDIAADEIFDPDNVRTVDVEDLSIQLEAYPNGNAHHYAEKLKLLHSLRESVRYSCRYPGHSEFWHKLVRSGFLDEKPLAVGDVSVAPRAFLTTLLASQAQFWYAANEQDFALVRVDARGTANGEPKRLVYQVLDRRDFETGFTAMQRTVGFTMAVGARLILEGEIREPGLRTALDVPHEPVYKGLEEHRIHVWRDELPWDGKSKD